MSAARALTVMAAGAWCTQAWAQPTTPSGGTSPIYLLLQALVSLAVVIGIIYLAYLGLRHLGRRQLGVSEEGPLRVIQDRHLGGDRWLYLVAVGGRRLLVGGGASGVQSIADLGEAERAEDDSIDL